MEEIFDGVWVKSLVAFVTLLTTTRWFYSRYPCFLTQNP